MKACTYSYRNHTIRIWRCCGVNQWCFDVLLWGEPVTCGARASWVQAARTAIARIDAVKEELGR